MSPSISGPSPSPETAEIDLAALDMSEDAELAILVVESAPDALLVTDRDGVITQVNRRVEALFGYERSDLIGQTIEVLLPEHSRQVHTAHRLRYVAQPQVRPMGLDLDLWARRADGAEFPVEIALSPCTLRGQDLVIASVRDVSTRRAAEQVMRNLLQMLEGVSEAVYLLDPDTFTFTYVNAAACTQSGYTSDELSHMTPLHLAPKLTATALRDLLEPLLSSDKRSLTLNTTLRHRDGNELSVECDISLPAALRGQSSALVFIIRDISERLALEVQARATQELAALLDDRERIARDLHDTVIQDLFATGLRLQSLSIQAPTNLALRLEEIVDRLDQTIRQIRTTVFRLESRHANHTSLLAQATNVIDEAGRVLGYRPAFRTCGAIDTIATPAYTEHLIPTLREWLSNIAHHAQATRVDIELALQETTLTLTITDDGIGIAPDDPTGNGIRNLTERAQQLGGTMTINPNPPNGTTLTWTVPA
ncbi:MAG: PAS domain S-box protein [Acidimicrobiales bacterium]